MNRQIHTIETTPTTPETFADAIGLVLSANGNRLDSVELGEALGLECADPRTELIDAYDTALNMLLEIGVIQYRCGYYSLPER